MTQNDTHDTEMHALRERERDATSTPTAFGDLPGGLTLLYNMETRCAELTHCAGDRQASLDLTTFNPTGERGGTVGRERFLALLGRHGLDPVADYARVQAYTEFDRQNWLYVWANEDLLLVTNNNPLTGDYTDPEGRMNEPGYASYMGLEGDEEAVDALFADVRETATYVKGVDALFADVRETATYVKGVDATGRGYI